MTSFRSHNLGTAVKRAVQNVSPATGQVRRRPLQLLLDLVFFTVFFVTPVFIHPSFKQVFNTPKYLLVGVLAVLAVALWLIEALHRRRITLPRSPTTILFSLFILWQAITLLWSPQLELSVRDFAVQLSFYALFLVAASCIRDKERIENLLHFAIAAGVIAAGFAMLQYYRLDHPLFTRLSSWLPWDLTFLILPQKPDEYLKIYSFMGHRNYLAGYLICLLPIILSRLVSSLAVAGSRGRYAAIGVRQSLVYGVSFFLMFVVVILTHTRGSWVGLAAGILVFIAVLFLKFRILTVWRPLAAVGVGMATFAVVFGLRNLSLGPFGPVWIVGTVGLAGIGAALSILACRGRSLVVALFIVAIVALPFGGMVSLSGLETNPLNQMRASALDRFADSFDLRRGSAFQRVLIWRTTWKIITDGPWNFFLGTGIGTYGLNYMPYQARLLQDPAMAERYERMINKSVYAHNEYLHFWSELGLIGLLLMVAAGCAFCYTMAGYVKRCEVTYQNLLLVGMFCSVVAVLAHNVFSFCLHLPYTAGLFYSLVAFCLRYEGAPPLRVTWGRRFGECVERFSVDGGTVVLSLLPLRGGRLRAFATWSTLPAHVRKESLMVRVEGPGGQKDAAHGAPLPSPGTLDVMIHERKASTAGWRIRLMDGDQTCGEARVPRHSSVDPALAPLLAWGGTIGLSSVAAVVLVGIINVGLLDLHWRDAFLKFRVRRFDDGRSHYSKVARLNSRRGDVLFDFGRSLMDSGRDLLAIEMFERAKGSFVDPANDHNIALCYFKVQEEEKAEEHYRRALSLNPIYEQSLANYGFYLVGQGRLDEARVILERGVRYYPRNPSIHASLGVLEARLENFDDAVRHLQRSVELDPTVASARVNLATVLYNMGNFRDSYRIYAQLLTERPSDGLVQRKYLGSSLAMYQQAVEERPDDLEALKGLGRSLEQFAQVDPARRSEAVEVLRRVLARRPNDGEARFYLGSALQGQGFLGEALSNFRAAEAFLDEDHPFHERTQERIRVLELMIREHGPVRRTTSEATTAPAPEAERSIRGFVPFGESR